MGENGCVVGSGWTGFTKGCFTPLLCHKLVHFFKHVKILWSTTRSLVKSIRVLESSTSVRRIPPLEFLM